jgi:hypothetical protein
MSSFVNNTNFEGKSAFEFYAAIIDSEFSSRSEFKNLSSVKNNVLVPQISLSGITKQGEYCDFGATGSVTLSRKSVEVCPTYVNLEICKKDIEPTFLSERMNAGQLNGEWAPSEMTTFLIDYVREQVLFDLEVDTWQGSTASCQGGLMGQGKADATTIKVSATASAITPSNVLTEIERVLAAVPDKVREKNDFRLYVSRQIAYAFRQAIGALTIPYFKAGEKPELAYNGYILKETPGLPAKEMFAANLSNLWNVNDLGSDEQRLLVVDMTNTSAEPKARLAMQFKYAPSYGIGAEVVIYS